MEFELLIDTFLSTKETSFILVKIIKKFLNNEIKVMKDEDGIYINCELFDISLLNQSDLKYIEEDYNSHVNVCIDINLLSKSYEIGISLLFKVLGEFIRNLNGSILFLGNSSIVIMRRDNSELFVSDNDYYNFQFPFDNLGIEYVINGEINSGL